jgi:hypothetical protein
MAVRQRHNLRDLLCTRSLRHVRLPRTRPFLFWLAHWNGARAGFNLALKVGSNGCYKTNRHLFSRCSRSLPLLHRPFLLVRNSGLTPLARGYHSMRLLRTLPALGGLFFGARASASRLDVRAIIDVCASLNVDLAVPDKMGKATAAGVVGASA